MLTITGSASGNAAAATTWNGGVCYACHARYVGSHACSREDVQKRIDALTALRDSLSE